ncbi:hypothetical protein BESB_023780 [Besnoitia besnoiti]|uniref:Uncharacterized protein n=1 Tax=Besnoitia besnoiti TaxID=94643 RepID=A0A2A9M7L1_BESBE|nr:hypothetical protein BESB_023780 [Besnoitia besnoiti]PFH31886.1 hypothetical protein BESB_023780 [Besnoitia besnoiti]
MAQGQGDAPPCPARDGRSPRVATLLQKARGLPCSSLSSPFTVSSSPSSLVASKAPSASSCSPSPYGPASSSPACLSSAASASPSASSLPSSSLSLTLSCSPCLSSLCRATLQRLQSSSEGTAALGKSCACLAEKVYAVALEREALDEAEQRRQTHTGEGDTEEDRRKDAGLREEGEDEDAISSADKLVITRLEPRLVSFQSLLNQERELVSQARAAVKSLDAALIQHMRETESPPFGKKHRAFPVASTGDAAAEDAAQPGDRSHECESRTKQEVLYAFLVLCHRLVAIMEEAADFRQDLKEELTHFAPAETFRAAKIALQAEPYVWDEKEILKQAHKCLDAWVPTGPGRRSL